METPGSDDFYCCLRQLRFCTLFHLQLLLILFCGGPANIYIVYKLKGRNVALPIFS